MIVPTPSLPDLSESRGALLVASSGGHLAQLFALRSRLGLSHEQTEWVTFETPQARSLLAGRVVHYAEFTAPRDFRAAAANVRLAHKLLKAKQFDVVVSTGSLLAASFLPLASLRSVRSLYVESAARVTGPSNTGRAMVLTPGVRTFTQHAAWSDRRWAFAGSVLDGFQPTNRNRQAGPLKVVVTLGTLNFPFTRMLKAALSALPTDAQVTWQVGTTPAPHCPGAVPTMPAHELVLAMREADVVIAHAGVGSALDALLAGHKPILMPRLSALGEHVDDHQVQIAAELERRGVAYSVGSDDALTGALLQQAALSGVRLDDDSTLLALTDQS